MPSDPFTTANAALVVAHSNAVAGVTAQLTACQQQHVKDLQQIAALQSQATSLTATITANAAVIKAANATIADLNAKLAAALQPVPTPTTQASSWLGWNADFVSYYTEPVLSDCLRQFSGGWSKPWPNNQTPCPVDANGYPTEPGTTTAGISMIHRSAGNYVVAIKGNCLLTIRGQAAPVWNGPGTLGGVAYDQIGTIHYVPTTDGANVFFDVAAADPSKPFSFTEGHVWHPSYEPGGANQGKTFLIEFIAPLKGSACLRVLQAMKMITRDDVNWSDRAKPTDFSWASGLPLEIAIQMAIEAGVTWLWYNGPLNGTDDYFTQAALTIKAKWGKPWVGERYDEFWNKYGEISRGYQKCLAIATDPVTGPLYDGTTTGGVWKQSPPGVSVTNSEERTWRVAGDLQHQTAEIFVVADPNCHPVLCGQAGDSRVLDWAAAYVFAKYGSPLFTDFAIAPYHEPLIGPKYSDAASFLAADAKFIAEMLPGQLSAFVSTCKMYGRGQMLYECGASYDDFYFYFSGDPAAIRAQIFASPQYQTNEAAYWPQLRAVAGVANVFVWYGSDGPWNFASGADGLIPAKLAANPRMMALRSAQ